MDYVIGYTGSTTYKIFLGQVNGTGNLSASTIYSATHNYRTTTPIISNIDGDTTSEITFMTSSDGVNWDAKTIDHTGGTVQASYCTALTCPEGENIATNMFLCHDETYCNYVSKDVCGYVKNSANMSSRKYRIGRSKVDLPWVTVLPGRVPSKKAAMIEPPQNRILNFYLLTRPRLYRVLNGNIYRALVGPISSATRCP